MIPIDQIVPGNPYSQDDAVFLMGAGSTEAAAKEVICEACRSGDLESRKWRRRYWFSGKNFLSWVSRWFGAEVGVVDDGSSGLAHPVPLRHDDLCRLGARSPTRREGR